MLLLLLRACFFCGALIFVVVHVVHSSSETTLLRKRELVAFTLSVLRQSMLCFVFLMMQRVGLLPGIVELPDHTNWQFVA